MRLQSAILDYLSYLAVMQLPATEEQILQYLRVRSSHLALKAELAHLKAEDKVVRVQKEYWGLKNVRYHNMRRQNELVERLMTRAVRWSRLMRLIPAVKAIVVVNSVSLGNPNKNSDIDLFIVTTPRRLYFCKGILMYGLKFLHQLEIAEHKAGRFSLGMFISTNGIKWERDTMKTNEPDLQWRYAMARPVYGQLVWHNLLRKSGYFAERLPNYNWSHMGGKVYRTGWRVFDWLDDIGYRRHLKHTSRQTKNHTERAFVRIRPDIINLHALDRTTDIAEKYHRIREKYS